MVLSTLIGVRSLNSSVLELRLVGITLPHDIAFQAAEDAIDL